jgi:hypothetical protein
MENKLAVAKLIEPLTTVVTSFVLIMVVGAIIALLSARSFGGNSTFKRETIFSTVLAVFLGIAAYYTYTRLMMKR